MRYWLPIATLMALLSAGCGASGFSQLEREQVVTTQLGDGAPVAIDAVLCGDSLEVSLGSIPREGTFVSLSLPAGQTISSQQWRGADALLHMAVPTGSGMDVGMVPLPDYDGTRVSATFELGTGAHAAGRAPLGPHNRVLDLVLLPAGSGHVRMEWTEVNLGDYNFDGLVNITDLAPLGAHYGERYERYVDGASLSTVYWVDGNSDGLVDLQDLQPLGAYYGARIYGYQIKRNGEVVAQPLTSSSPTVLRGEAMFRDGPRLPPRYSAVLAGDADDDWQVVPVDAQGQEGSGSVINWGVVDAAVSASVLGTGIAHSFESGGSILRLIDPSDIVNRMEIDERLLIKEQGHRIDVDTGTTYFVQLPRQKRLFLDIFYTPSVDLRTGSATPTTVVTTVPFTLSGGSTPLGLDVAIELEQQLAGGGYYGYLNVTKIQGAQVEVSRTRVDYATGVVSRLTDESHTFDDEAELSDEDRDGVSEARYQQEILYSRYSPAWANHVTLEGTVKSFDERAGVFELTGAVQRAPVEILVGTDLTLQFSELTGFAERGAAPGDPSTPIDPSALIVGDLLVADALVFSGAGQAGLEIWAKNATRQPSGT